MSALARLRLISKWPGRSWAIDAALCCLNNLFEYGYACPRLLANATFRRMGMDQDPSCGASKGVQMKNCKMGLDPSPTCQSRPFFRVAARYILPNFRLRSRA